VVSVTTTRAKKGGGSRRATRRRVAALLCRVHFERNVLSHVPATSMGEVAEDLSRRSS
jgi:transposase-like protein